MALNCLRGAALLRDALATTAARQGTSRSAQPLLASVSQHSRFALPSSAVSARLLSSSSSVRGAAASNLTEFSEASINRDAALLSLLEHQRNLLMQQRQQLQQINSLSKDTTSSASSSSSSSPSTSSSGSGASSSAEAGGKSDTGSSAVVASDDDANDDDMDVSDPNALEPANMSLLPREVVAELDRHIVGQSEAKRAVAIALRNRWRRQRVPEALMDEIQPKNILMIGPTGVGKTEIARRLAKLCDSPFIKVEATKFTEIGFHGASVDSIIRDLVDLAIIQTKNRLKKRFRKKIDRAVEERLLDILTGESAPSKTKDSFRELLRDGSLDAREVEFDAPEQMPGRLGAGAPGGFEAAGVATISLENFLGRVIPNRQKRKMSVAECRPFLEEQESDKILNQDVITKQALEAVENHGIVFIDEIDKICVDHSTYHGTDASSEGVQRDLLPLIEGCTIQTKYGNVDTSKILFVASGAFHSCKPSDLLAELQGRLPIRVELKGLTEDDLYKILTEPESNLIHQQMELLKTEGINLSFSSEAMREIAVMAANVNTTVENIGARRLHTVIERIIEEVSFNCDKFQGQDVLISQEDVKRHLASLLVRKDLHRLVL